MALALLSRGRDPLLTGSIARRGFDLGIVAVAVILDGLAYRGVEPLAWGAAAPAWALRCLVGLCYIVLLLRWVRPREVLVVLACFSVAMGLSAPGVSPPITGLVVAGHAIGRQLPVLTGAVWMAVTAPVLGLAAAHSGNIAGNLLLLGVLIGGAWALGVRAHTVATRAEQLTREVEARKEREAAELLRAERLRLARELHDIVSHSVSAMLLQAAGARAMSGRDEARVASALASIERTGVQAMRELNRLLGVLRDESGPGPREDLQRSSLARLDDLIGSARASGVTVHLNVQGEHGEVDPSVDLAAYRVVQESLSNVMKHGGREPEATVDLTWSPEQLRIRVRSLTGFVDHPQNLPPGYGLRGLRERVEMLGGQFHSGLLDGGFLTTATLPVLRTALVPRQQADSS